MKIITFTLALLTSAVTLGQDFKLYEKAVFTFENDTLNYRILKPLNYDSNKQYPVLLFLHGAGERGDDNSSQLTHGGRLFLDTYNRKKYNSWVIFPQYSKDDRWANLVNDDWDLNFKDTITKPNKSLNLVIRFMDEFIQKNKLIRKEFI